MTKFIFATMIHGNTEKPTKQHIVREDSDGLTLCGKFYITGEDIDDEKRRDEDLCKSCLKAYNTIKFEQGELVTTN